MRRLAAALAIIPLALAAVAQPDDAKPKSVPAAKITPMPAAPAKPEPTGKVLKVGDAAPAIMIDAWLAGNEVKAFERGRVYAVEFWATWCPPCIDSIPHLTKLQKDHKGLTVIGVAASERGEGDARLAKLRAFIKDQGPKMAYTVAFDGDREMAKGWLEAARKGSIPTSFVVDAEGVIAFIGHPMDPKFDGAIKAALDKANRDGAQRDGAKPDKAAPAPVAAP